MWFKNSTHLYPNTQYLISVSKIIDKHLDDFVGSISRIYYVLLKNTLVCHTSMS